MVPFSPVALTALLSSVFKFFWQRFGRLGPCRATTPNGQEGTALFMALLLV